MPHPPKRHCTRPTTTYLDLDDDVLRVIFRNLNARDLCSVAVLCAAFKRNAQEEFALRYNDLHFTFHVPNDASSNYNLNMKTLHVRQLASALRNFGPSLCGISININLALRNQSQQIMEMVIKYCGESLNELALTDIDFNADIVREMQSLLSRLLSICSLNIVVGHRKQWNQKCFHSVLSCILCRCFSKTIPRFSKLLRHFQNLFRFPSAERRVLTIQSNSSLLPISKWTR